MSWIILRSLTPCVLSFNYRRLTNIGSTVAELKIARPLWGVYK